MLNFIQDYYFLVISLPILNIIYFLPTIIAFHADHKKSYFISIINLIFGWTIICWFLLLLWLFWMTKKKETNVTIQEINEPLEENEIDLPPVPLPRCTVCNAPAIPGDSLCYAHNN